MNYEAPGISLATTILDIIGDPAVNAGIKAVGARQAYVVTGAEHKVIVVDGGIATDIIIDRGGELWLSCMIRAGRSITSDTLLNEVQWRTAARTSTTLTAALENAR